MGHSEACRNRVEEKIAEDKTDDRAQKAREMIVLFMAQRVADGEEKVERDDPQMNEPNTAQQNAPEGAEDAPMQAENFEIGSLVRAGHGECEDVLEDGPTGISERQFHTPVRAPPVKRKNTVHSEEPGTKKFVMDGDDAGRDILMGELSDLRGLGYALVADRAIYADEEIVISYGGDNGYDKDANSH